MYYQRNLPHMMPPGATLFSTFRLAGSLPQATIEELRAVYTAPVGEREEYAETHARRQRYFGAFAEPLDAAAPGPQWLAQADVAAVVAQAPHYRAGRAYTPWAYCLMRSHVHPLVSLPEITGQPFFRVLQSPKTRTARRCNELLGRSGEAFWQPESYDHCVRDAAQRERVVAYSLHNPVKAGLVEDWMQWPATYLNPDW